MAGNKKLQADTDVLYNDAVSDGSNLHESPQTATLETPTRVNTTRTKKGPAGPFNFGTLTSQYKIGIIKNGITKNQLEAIKSETDFDYRTLSGLLSVSRTTLIKKKGDERFDQPTSERIMILAELISYGRDVFESRERFNAWIKEPSMALGNKTPLELLDTVYGIEEVKKELGRIEYGVY
jgi:putative toxin-antitoxin system antitoxin component (TIGR02293 family)